MKNIFDVPKFIFHFVFIFSLCCLSTLSWGNENNSLKQTTNELIQISNRFSANQQVPEATVKHAIEIAQTRQALLIKQLAQPSKDVEKFLLPKNISKKFPKEVAAYLEQEMVLEGTLEIRAALYLGKEKGEAIQYLLNTKDGKIYNLHFTNAASQTLKTGTVIKVNKALVLKTVNDVNEAIVNANDISIIKQVMIKPDGFGQQKTIAILVNFQNQPTNQPWTKETVRDMVFNTVNRFYYESSYNQTNIVGDAIGWFTLPLTSTTDCNTITNNIPAMAEQAARNSGVDLTPYIHRVYLFPYIQSCGWAGLGTIGRGGAYSNAWINGYNDLRVIGHELGHNVGIWHSNRFQCPGPFPQGSCTPVEYGDYADTMGWGFGTHFNAYQKEVIGWLNYGTSPTIQTVTTSGTYTIAPYELRGTTPESNIKALKILRRTLPDGTKDYYYFEFRQPIGFDANLGACGSSCDFTRGVLMHNGNSSNTNSSYAIDPSPSTTNPAFIALLPGQAYSDATAENGGITVTVNSVSATGAVVDVKIGNTPPPPTCTRAEPTMTINPNTMVVMPSGISKSYAVTLTNNDSVGCAPTQYSLSVPRSSTYMIGGLTVASVIVDPGKTANIGAVVWTVVNTPPGLYFFGVLANNVTTGASSGVSGGFIIK